MLVSKYFCIVYILYIFVVTYYLTTDSIKDFFFKAIRYSESDLNRPGSWRAASGGAGVGAAVMVGL